MTRFTRTVEENHSVGYFPEGFQSENDDPTGGEDAPGDTNETGDLADEVLKFATSCSSCGRDCSTKMKLTKIPHFKV